MLITPPVLKQIPIQSSTNKKMVHDNEVFRYCPMMVDIFIYLSDLKSINNSLNQFVNRHQKNLNILC